MNTPAAASRRRGRWPASRLLAGAAAVVSLALVAAVAAPESADGRSGRGRWSATPTPFPTAVARTATPRPRATPTPSPTPRPTRSASAAPALAPTLAPGASPVAAPVVAPAPELDAAPSLVPLPVSTTQPSAPPSPTAGPTASPAASATTTPAPTAPATGFITACGTRLCLDGVQWRLHGASVYGGLAAPSTVVAQARAAGLNTVRITNWLDESAAGSPTDEVRWRRVDALLAALRSAGLHAILDLSTYRNQLWNAGLDPYLVDWGPVVRFVANRVNTVNGLAYRDDPTIAMVAFAGEVEPPAGSYDARNPTPAQLTEFFRRTFAQWRAIDGRHLLESGGLLQLDWNSGVDWRAIFAMADLCSVHNYSAGDVSITPTIAAWCGAAGKPWITEEFGWEQSVGDLTRAASFASMFTLQATHGAAGAAFWNLGSSGGHDVGSQTPLTLAEVLRRAP